MEIKVKQTIEETRARRLRCIRKRGGGYSVDIPTAWTLQFLNILIHAVDGLLSCSPSSMIADGSLKQNLSDLLLTELRLCLRYKARD